MSLTVFDKGQGKKRIILTAVAVVLIAAILVGVVILNANSKHSSDGGGARYIEYEGKQYVLKDGIETFLVLGLDKYDGEIGDASYNNDQQADFLLLIVFDNYAKTYSSIHINRDTVAEMNVLGIGGKNVGTTKKQISLSHTYGEGGEISNKNTADAVSKLLGGVKINYTMSLTLDSVGIMNDLVGGVTVEILDDFSGVSGAEGLVKGEMVTLKGDQALLYVRSRKGLEDSSNSARMERQRQYLSALREKMSDCAENDANFYTDTVTTMSKYIVYDCGEKRLKKLGDKMEEYSFVEIEQIKGETRTPITHNTEYVEFHPDEDSVKKMVVEQFYTLKK